MAKGKFEDWLTPDGLLKIKAYARDGLTDVQIAHNMGIAECTLYEYKKRFPKINEAIKRGKEVVDIEVENALFKSATGYDYEETTELVKDVDGKKTKEVTRTKKHAQGNTTAQIFWLKNRLPQKWRDVNKGEMKVTHQGEVEVKNPEMDLSKLSNEELSQLEEIIKKSNPDD
jgi:hypothetical protein